MKFALIIAVTVIVFNSSVRAESKKDVCLPARYSIFELPLLPVHIDNAGRVSGMTAAHQSAMWINRKGLQPLSSYPYAAPVEVTGANNLGVLVGSARSKNNSQAFIYRGDSFFILQGAHAKAFALNDSGQTVGESMFPGKASTQPVLWDSDGPIDIGACCGGTAKSINNRGEVVGDMYDEHAQYHAFLWTRKNGLRRLDDFHSFSSAIAINSAGHVVVQAMSDGVFLYADATLTKVKLSNNQPTSPQAINNCDVIVGSYGPFSDAERAFAWDKNRGFVDLNDLLPLNSGWKLEVASGINDRGEIVGRGDHGADDVGFLMVPRKHKDRFWAQNK